MPTTKRKALEAGFNKSRFRGNTPPEKNRSCVDKGGYPGTLKLTHPLKIELPRKESSIPIIHFQGLLLLVSGGVSSSQVKLFIIFHQPKRSPASLCFTRVSLGLFHPYKWSYYLLLVFRGPPSLHMHSLLIDARHFGSYHVLQLSHPRQLVAPRRRSLLSPERYRKASGCASPR